MSGGSPGARPGFAVFMETVAPPWGPVAREMVSSLFAVGAWSVAGDDQVPFRTGFDGDRCFTAASGRGPGQWMMGNRLSAGGNRVTIRGVNAFFHIRWVWIKRCRRPVR